jgi:hypothetical protein
VSGWVPGAGPPSVAGMRAQRCGRHVVRANPASRIPVWMECAVHRFTPLQLTRRFTEMVQIEFSDEEALRLGWIVEHAML